MKGLILSLFVLLSISLTAQQFPCAQIIQKAIKAENQSFVRENNIVIPVVFHIVYQNDNQNIPLEKILNLLASVNADFNLANSDKGNIPYQSLGNLGNVGFQFKLAEIDPEGNATAGITRIQTDDEKIGNLLDSEGRSWIKQNIFGGSDPWPLDDYLNIWVGERTLSLGYTFSKNSKGNDDIGIVLDYRTISPFDRTLTHEMGHFFGLLHPWGNFTGCDDEDDEIEDTPFQAYPDFSCKPVAACGITSKTGNFMDFNTDECLLYFTKGQSLSIQQFTSMFMSNLIESNDCFNPNFPDKEALFFYNKVYQAIEIYLPEEQRNIGIALYSIDGKQILKTSSKSENYINIPTKGISVGIYVLQFVVGDKLTAHKIIIY